MNSPFGKLNFADIVQSAGLAVAGAVLNALYQLVQTCTSFTCFSTFDWGGLFQIALWVGVSSILANFVTTKDGKLGGLVKTK